MGRAVCAGVPVLHDGTFSSHGGWVDVLSVGLLFLSQNLVLSSLLTMWKQLRREREAKNSWAPT